MSLYDKTNGHEDHSLEGEIRKAIRESGLSFYRIAQLSDTSAKNISRFMNAGFGISMQTADKIIAGLHLQVRLINPAAGPSPGPGSA